MSWGTYYKHTGYLPRVAKDSVDYLVDECNSRIDMYFRDILAYMASTPPAFGEDIEGEKIPWPEVISTKVKELREALEEDISLRTRLEECLEVMREFPEDVTEG